MTPSSPRELSSWACNIEPSPTLAVDARAKALQAAGEDVCGFGAGEPDFDTPDFLKEACIAALRAGATKYAPAAGLLALRQALAEKHGRAIGAPVEAAQVVVSPGGKFSCHLAIVATCSPGDEAIIPAPYWVSYPEMVKLAGARPVIVHGGVDQGFKVTAEQVEAAITPRTRLFVLNSPSNPTGAVYTRAEMEAIVDVCLRHGLWILSDEIYEDLVYEGAQHHSPASFSAEARAAVITVGGFSKSYSMTGWRLGTLVAPKAVAQAAADLQSQMTSAPTTFAMHGALAALKEPARAAAAVAEMKAVFDRRRRYLHGRLAALPGVRCPLPQGAFYVFPDVSAGGLGSNAFAARLLDEEKVAVVPGVAFGDDSCLRLSYATSDAVIEKGADRLERFWKALRG